MPTGYRIAKSRHPPYSAESALRVGGRWTSPGVSVIYAAEHFATAMLEILVHHGRVALPGAHRAVKIDVPNGVRIERFDPNAAAHDGWELEGSEVARRYGDAWFAAARSALLLVPSVAGWPVEWNWVINPAHPDARRIRVGDAFDVPWDARLFR